eukprot:scaffold58157_cov22-Prasinocladus_malaysianus.AAC.1
MVLATTTSTSCRYRLSYDSFWTPTTTAYIYFVLVVAFEASYYQGDDKQAGRTAGVRARRLATSSRVALAEKERSK